MTLTINATRLDELPEQGKEPLIGNTLANTLQQQAVMNGIKVTCQVAFNDPASCRTSIASCPNSWGRLSVGWLGTDLREQVSSPSVDLLAALLCSRCLREIDTRQRPMAPKLPGLLLACPTVDQEPIGL